MTIAHKNAGGAVTTSYTTFYTCPGSTIAIIKKLRIANVDGTVAADINAKWTDSSAAGASRRIAHTISCPADCAVDLIGDGYIVPEAGDTLQLQASAGSVLEATFPIMEIS